MHARHSRLKSSMTLSIRNRRPQASESDTKSSDQRSLGPPGSRVIAAVVPHYLLALKIVADSDLVAVLPTRLIAKVGTAFGVEARDLPLAQQADQIWLLHPSHHDTDPASLWLRRIVTQSLK
jgi:DNA-binding transcriptional LysR family regulator